LSHLEHSGADAITISSAHLIVRQSFNGEVFAELSIDEAAPFQLILPMAVGFGLVDEDRAAFTSVSGQVTLTVPRKI
jgi:hypothetical protein